MKGKNEFSLHHYFLFALMGLILFLVYGMLAPYLNSIIMGVLLSFLFMPLNHRYLNFTKNRKNLSAMLSCITLAFLVVIPLAFILISIILQGIKSMESIYSWFASGGFDIYADKVTDNIISLKDKFPFISSLIPETDFLHGDIEKQILNYSSNSLKWLVGQASQILGSTVGLGMSFFLMMVIFFIMIRDGDKIIDSLLHIIPLKSSQEKKIINKTEELFKSVIMGNIFTSIAQGIAGGIGFAIAGLPAIFWGAAIALASLIPVVGTAIIWIPASLWLYISGRPGTALFLAIWFVIVVGLIDNILRPVFMKSEGGMGPVMIFFAILGGINYWGLLGLIYGPMVFGLGFVIIYIYEIEFHDYLKKQDKS